MKRTKPLRRSGRLRAVSSSVHRQRKGWAEVYAQVDRRSRKRCERCGERATDRHHTRKPRRSWHAPEWIVALCRDCHARCEAPYAKGRIEVTPLGDGRFTFELVVAKDKWEARRLA